MRGARPSSSSSTASATACGSNRAGGRPRRRLEPTSSSGPAARGCPSSSPSRSSSASRGATSSSSAATLRGADTPGFCDYDAPFYGHGDIGGLGVKVAPDVASDEIDPDRLDRLPLDAREQAARALTRRGGSRRSPAHRSSARASASTTSPPDTHFLFAPPPRARRRGGSSAAAQATASSTARRSPSTSPTASRDGGSRSRSTRSARAPATPGCAQPSAARRRSRLEREHQLAQQLVQLHLLVLRQRRGEERLLAAPAILDCRSHAARPSGVSSTTTPRRSPGSGSRRMKPELLQAVEAARHRARLDSSRSARARRASCGGRRFDSESVVSTRHSGGVRS